MQAPISTGAFSPARNTNTPARFMALISTTLPPPKSSTAFRKRRKKVRTKKSVLKNAAEKEVTVKASRLFPVFLSQPNRKPTKSPMSRRGTMHRNAVLTGLMLKQSIPKALMPKHWMKLEIPKIRLMTADAPGPTVVAAMATGMVRKVISMTPA